MPYHIIDLFILNFKEWHEMYALYIYLCTLLSSTVLLTRHTHLYAVGYISVTQLQFCKICNIRDTLNKCSRVDPATNDARTCRCSEIMIIRAICGRRLLFVQNTSWRRYQVNMQATIHSSNCTQLKVSDHWHRRHAFSRVVKLWKQ